MKVTKKTVCDIFLYRTEISSELGSIGSIENNQVQVINFASYKNIVESLTLGLMALGLKQQSKVCILSHTRKDWHFLDLSILCSGAICVPIYPNYPSKDIKFILEHAQSSILIVENEEQFKKIIPISAELEDLTKIICIEPVSNDLKSQVAEHITVINYEELMNLGIDELQSHPDQFHLTIQNISEESTATIVYTSGTTGEPKGAVITHKALYQVLENIKKYCHHAFHELDRLLTFLPLSHVLGRCESFFPMLFGCEAIYAESHDPLLENIKVARPTLMIAVPRIFEKIYENVMSEINKNPLQKGVFDWAMKCTNEYYETIDNDRTPKTSVMAQYYLAQKTIFEKIYAQFGGNLRYFISGGAPLSVNIIKFLRNANLTVLEGYGLTETVAPCCVNPMNKQIPGTVGQPLGDVELKFLEDGEILIKSEAMFKEYYKNPEATSQVLDEDGWFHTGDLGKITPQGFLKITGRKKDLIITSSGKNIPPQKIETLLKNSLYINEACLIGDKKKFITALISINKEAFLKHYDEFEITEDADTKFLSTHPKIESLIKQEIELINEELASFEQIKRFKILPLRLTTQNYLTPSLKLKKKKIHKDFKNLIDAMYK